MGFSHIGAIALAGGEGAYDTSFIHKTGSPILPGAGYWGDLSMAAGIPKYNAYVGTQYEGTPIYGAGNAGLYVGGAVSPQTKHLYEIYLATTATTLPPAEFILCDYLYTYVLTDMDTTDVQVFDSSVSAVPRYPDGNGVQAIVVCTTPQTAITTCTVSYTNELGVSGRISTFRVNVANTGNLNCSIATDGIAGGMTPFIPLASGDKGIRSIDSVTMSGSAGGFCAFTLVKPLANTIIREVATVTEKSYITNNPSLPQIKDGAYLNFIFTSGQAAASSLIRGSISYVWR